MFADDNEKNQVSLWSVTEGFPPSVNLVFIEHHLCAKSFILLGWESLLIKVVKLIFQLGQKDHPVVYSGGKKKKNALHKVRKIDA